MSNDFTKDMLSKIRENTDKSKRTKVQPLTEETNKNVKVNMITEWNDLVNKALKKKVIKEDVDVENSDVDVLKGKKFKITKSTPQFGDIRETQESDLVKTIGEGEELVEDAFIYYE
jgi:hypothetical protein